MIICGGSAYPREWDYARLRSIADKVGAYLLSDMAHIRCGVSRFCPRLPFKPHCATVARWLHDSV